MQHSFDAIANTDSAGLNSACLMFGIASLSLFLYNGTVWSIYAPFITRLEGKLRIKLFEKIASFSCEHIESVTYGEWLTRLNTDVEMPFSRPMHFPHGACALINIIVSALILWNINSTLFGFVMLFVVPHIAVSQLLIARAMPKLNAKSLEAAAKNTGELTALITCADITALYDGYDFLMKRFTKSSLELLRANMRIRAKNALSAGIIPLFGLSGYLTLLIVCSNWIGAGQFTFGDLTAAFQYRGGVLVGSLTLINSLISIQASMAGIKRLNKTMTDLEVQDG